MSQREGEGTDSSGICMGQSTGVILWLSDLVQTGCGNRVSVGPVPTTWSCWEDSLLYTLIHSSMLYLPSLALGLVLGI